MIKLVLDSTADIPADLRERYGIEVVPLIVQFGSETFLDNVTLTRDMFYERLQTSSELPRTAAPPVGAYEEMFKRLAAEGHEIISISVAASLSSTYSSAVQAARLVEGATIACVDSASAAMPISYLAIAAGDAIAAGKSLDEVVALLEALKKRIFLYVALDTLHYLEKGGRIGRMRALLGTMLSVKPILEFRNGDIIPTEQVRTWKRVPPRLAELMQPRAPYEQLSVLYTTGIEQAERLRDLCGDAGLMPREQIRIVQANSALGTHVGPRALGISGQRSV